MMLIQNKCNTAPPRTFSDQAAVFGPMADVWSGAIIYEWIQELNDYGLVSYGPQQEASVNDGSSVIQGSYHSRVPYEQNANSLFRFTRQGVPTPVSPDFANLKAQWATLSPTGVDSSAYAKTVTTTAPTCPPSTAGTSAWTIDPSAPLPTMGAVATTGENSGPSISIPSGSITVSVLPSSGPGTENGPDGSNPSGSASNLPQTGGSSNATTTSGSTASGSAAKSSGAGSRSVSPPIQLSTTTVVQTFLALAGICFGAMVFL